MLRRLLLLLLAVVPAAFGQDLGRVDCHPEPNPTQKTCEDRQCIWTPTTNTDLEGAPSCYMQTDKIGYVGTSADDGSISLAKNTGPPNPWGTDFPTLRFSSKDLTNGVVQVRIETSNKRYEPDVLNLPRATIESTETLTVVPDATKDPFSFTVTRKDGTNIFDTSIGGLIFSDKFIQIVTRLPSKYLYGFGENSHPTLNHDFTRYTTWGMFGRDITPTAIGLDTKNLYGAHPYYTLIEESGKAHGVLILNSYAQEVTTLPSPALVYRTIGGVLDMYFFPGPTPADVTHQYLAFIGKPMLPAYWALGYQLCRYGYRSLAEMKQRVLAVRENNIPIDVAYADIDYMDRYKDFTTDSKLWPDFGAYIDEMHSLGMKSILIFDPAIEATYPPFERAMKRNVSFVEWERMDQVQREVQDQYPLAKDTKVMLGVVWPDNHVAFPDFLDPTGETERWWIDELVNYHDSAAFDGAWIDMNEPSVFGTNDPHPWYFDMADHPNITALRCPTEGPDAQFDVPPYQSTNVWHWLPSSASSVLASATLCMLGTTERGATRLYDTKLLYGWAETVSTEKAVHKATGKRGAVISRATFPSSGRYAGHWLGDNTARWEDMRQAVIGAMEFNMFGIPYVGSDVCGFNGEAEEEMCLRWQQLGAFHSFYRNHNTLGAQPQDPATWPSVAAVTRDANLFRYSYLPYLFSLHFRASLYGDTVVRPLFYDFPSDVKTYTLSEQFMWGPSFIVLPVLYPSATTVTGYVPPSSSFYSLFPDTYGQPVETGSVTFAAPLGSFTPALVRAGTIIPRQTGKMTTTATRQTAFQLLIATTTDGSLTAAGELFWDDGESIVESFDTHPYYHILFSYKGDNDTDTLTITANSTANGVSLSPFDHIEMFQYPSEPDHSSFTVDGHLVAANTTQYDVKTLILNVHLDVPIDFSTGTHTITWKKLHTKGTAAWTLSAILISLLYIL